MGTARSTRCRACRGQGYLLVRGCILDDPEIRGALELLEHADRFLYRGIAPCAGGSLDQAQVFLKACEAYQREDSRVRTRIKLPARGACPML
jgi:hypothetical protein